MAAAAAVAVAVAAAAAAAATAVTAGRRLRLGVLALLALCFAGAIVSMWLVLAPVWSLFERVLGTRPPQGGSRDTLALINNSRQLILLRRQLRVRPDPGIVPGCIKDLS